MVRGIRGGAGEELGAESQGEFAESALCGPARALLAEMAEQEDATAMGFGEAGEVIELRGIDGWAEVGVQGVEDEEPGVGALEGVFEDGGGDGAGAALGDTQDDEAGGVAMEGGEARVKDLRGVVLGRDVESGAGWCGCTALGLLAAAESGGDGEGEEGLSCSGLAGEHG